MVASTRILETMNCIAMQPSTTNHATNLQDAEPLVVLQNSSDLDRLLDGDTRVVERVAAGGRRVVEAKLDIFEVSGGAGARPRCGLGTVDVDVHVPRSLVALVHR